MSDAADILTDNPLATADSQMHLAQAQHAKGATASGVARSGPGNTGAGTASPLVKGLLLAGAAAALAAAGYVAWRRWQRRQQQRRQSLPLGDLSSNHLLHLGSLQHNYFMVRHGESTANVARVISSAPAISCATHGLTERGREQVAQQVGQWSVTLPPNQPVVVLSSDFLRAAETAQIVHHRLRVRHPLQLHPELRERNFGTLNGQHTDNYARVWEHDARSAAHTEFDCESVDAVVSRTTAFIRQIEEGLADMLQAHAADDAAADATGSSPASAVRRLSAADGTLRAGPAPRHSVILVAHGDVCQILSMAFRRADPRLHRSLTHWENGEMRPLVLGPRKEVAVAEPPAPDAAELAASH